MNECIDSSMGHIHVCFAVLLTSDDPRTSRSFHKDNVVADVLSRYPELAGQSYDHLLSEKREMDLLCAHPFNITTTGGDATLCVDDVGSTTQHLAHKDYSPVDYSEVVVENLSLPPPSKIGVDGYAASSFVSVDSETSAYYDTYPKCSDFQTMYVALQERRL